VAITGGALTINGAPITPGGGTPGAHAPTHAAGGSDPVALSAAQITSGTLPDARLSSNVALKNINNQFSDYQTIQAGYAQLVLHDLNGAVNARRWGVMTYNGDVIMQARNDDDTYQNNSLQIARNGNLTVAGSSYLQAVSCTSIGCTFITSSGDIYSQRNMSADAAVFSPIFIEAGRSTPLGHWINVPYAASNFVGSQSMTWTVESADVQTYAYTLIGNTMLLSVCIYAASVGGTPDAYLMTRIPGGFSARQQTEALCWVLNNGAVATGRVRTFPSDGYVYVMLQAGGNWQLGAGTNYISFQITIQIG